MNEINNNKKVVNVIPGSDYVTDDLVKYPLTNMILAGTTGSGLSNIVNNIIMSLVNNTSPRDLSIEMYCALDLHSKTFPWLNENRTIPHFSMQSYVAGAEWLRIEEIAMIISALEIAAKIYDDFDEKVSDKRVLLIVDVRGRDVTYPQRRVLEYIAKFGPRFGVNLFLITYSTDELDYVLEYTPLRLFTRGYGNSSEMVLKCDIGLNEKQSHGFVWVFDVNKPYTYKKLNVKFYPDTFLNKYCKVFSTKYLIEDDGWYGSYTKKFRDGSLTAKDLPFIPLFYELTEDMPYVSEAAIEHNVELIEGLPLPELRAKYLNLLLGI